MFLNAYFLIWRQHLFHFQSNWFQFNQCFVSLDASHCVAVFYVDCFTVNIYGSFCWHLVKLQSYNCWQVIYMCLQGTCGTVVYDNARQIINKKTNSVDFNLVNLSATIELIDAFHGETVFILIVA